jgi:uncharacterized protein DUF4265
VGVVKDAGNYTFRVSFDDAPNDDRRWHELIVALEPFDCWVDVRDPGFLAVSAPPGEAQAVADYLDARERRGELSFETGRSSAP